jgi:hypothetical protein
VAFGEREWRKAPVFRIEDAYKWLFQACRGGEHATSSREAAQAWLENEWAGLGPALEGEPLVVPLRPDGAIVRLNLRPFRDRGGRREALLEAFLRSGASFSQDERLFRETWRALGEQVRSAPIGALTLAEWRRMDTAAAGEGYRASHHSAAYAAANTPAYRVLTASEAGLLVASLGVAAR